MCGVSVVRVACAEGRRTPLVGPPAVCQLWTAAVMCRFAVGSLTRARFDLGRGGSAVSTDSHGEADRRICGLQNFSVNALELFRCAYTSMCVLFDVRTFRFAYF